MSSASSRSPFVTRERLLVGGLLLFTALIRGGVLWAMRDNLQQDPDAYREIAENILAHGVYGLGKASAADDPFGPAQPLRPTAYRPPLYPILLSNLPAADRKHVSLALVAVVHVLLGAATVWLTYLTGRRMVGSSRREDVASGGAAMASGGREPPEAIRVPVADHGTPQRAFPTALLAALLVACDPILLNQQTLVMTETLAAFLAILALWCLARFAAYRYWWNAGLAGGAIGLAALCRPTFLPWVGLVAVAMVISDFRFQISDWNARLARNLGNVAALAVAAAAVMSPWAIRNQREFGQPILTTTHGGYTLALGNNESFYEWLSAPPHDEPWNSVEFELELQVATILTGIDELSRAPASPAAIHDPLTEQARDLIAYRRARNAIGNNPRMFARSCLYRIRQLWSPLPNKLTADESTSRRLLRYATAAWYCGVYVLVAVGIWRLRWQLIRPPWVWGVLLCLTFTAVHTLYWCNLRMRAPLMPFVALVAGAALMVSPAPRGRESLAESASA